MSDFAAVESHWCQWRREPTTFIEMDRIFCERTGTHGIPGLRLCWQHYRSLTQLFEVAASDLPVQGLINVIKASRRPILDQLVVERLYEIADGRYRMDPQFVTSQEFDVAVDSLLSERMKEAWL